MVLFLKQNNKQSVDESIAVKELGGEECPVKINNRINKENSNKVGEVGDCLFEQSLTEPTNSPSSRASRSKQISSKDSSERENKQQGGLLLSKSSSLEEIVADSKQRLAYEADFAKLTKQSNKILLSTLNKRDGKLKGSSSKSSSNKRQDKRNLKSERILGTLDDSNNNYEEQNCHQVQLTTRNSKQASACLDKTSIHLIDLDKTSACNSLNCDGHNNNNNNLNSQQIANHKTGTCSDASKVSEDNNNNNSNISLTIIFGQLLSFVFVLLLLLYLLNSLQRLMTNLFSKFLGVAGGGLSERRRSLAASSGSGRDNNHNIEREASGNSNLSAQSQHSSSTLSMPQHTSSTLTRNKNQNNSQQRRASKSSLHSVSAMFLNAFAGSSGTQSSSNNGRSIIAKNKEDTVILASSSPTIIQKESTDSATSTVVSAASSPAASSNSNSQVVVNSLIGTSSGSIGIGSSSTGSNISTGSTGTTTIGNVAMLQEAATAASDAELARIDQNLYDLVLRQQPLIIGNTMSQVNLLAIAAAAAKDPLHQQAGSANQSQQQLPNVATQVQSTLAEQAITHAPLNASNTMKQAPSATQTTSSTKKSLLARKNEVIKITEILLNALNQGDYETYSRLCDPHMTSFEPENLGNLIDNMEYRQFCLDQARQLQFTNQIQIQQQQHLLVQQVTLAAAEAAAAATAITTANMNMTNSCNNNSSSSNSNNNNNNNNNQTNSSQQSSPSGKSLSSSGQQQQQIQQIAAAAASAALANLNLKSNSNSSNNNMANELLTRANCASTTSSINSCRQYSLILNPSVYLLGEEAATIAYTKLDQIIDLKLGSLTVEQSEETRVWHKRDGNKWLCVHLHRSLGNGAQNKPPTETIKAVGPQTNASLIRSVANQQQLANWLTLQSLQQQQQRVTGVPLISFNNSSANKSASNSSSSASTSTIGQQQTGASSINTR